MHAILLGLGNLKFFDSKRGLILVLPKNLFYLQHANPCCYYITGNAGHFDGQVSPLRYLKMAAEWYATAIKLSPKTAELHFQLGQVFEEQHYVQDVYGIKPSVSSSLLI